jgi:hypothetical protein
MKVVGSVIGALVLVLALTWAFQGNDFFLYKVFAPKYEDVRRETFEHSRSFRQGNVQELQKMALEYNSTPDSGKDALASVILQRAANIDESILPQDLRSFISDLRRERMGKN